MILAGLANIYSGGTSARHISTPPSPAVGVASTYDRPITMIGNMPHSHPTHVQVNMYLIEIYCTDILLAKGSTLYVYFRKD